jgi:spore germination protein YaaH
MTYPTVDAVTSGKYFLESVQKPHARLTKQTLGFLPYWRVDDAQYARLDLLSEINYFGLSITPDGNFKKTVDTETDPGWREWNTQSIKDFVAKTHIMGGAFSVTIINQKNEDIESFLDNKIAQQTLTNNLIEQIKTRTINDINIDFEYFGEPDETYKNKFTQFIKSLRVSMKQETPKTTLTLSIMPRAARDNDLFDFPKIVPDVDRFIGMSYDYYGSSSDISGPVAPMNGYADKTYFFDVTTTYNDYLKYIPKNKILMGIPYYGWDRAVVDGQKIKSKTFAQDNPNNYAAVISYARMREEKNIDPKQCSWDEVAQETWCWYTDEKTGIDHQVWLADNKSIGVRYDFANKQNFAGIAIWVLGYDKDYPDLWNIMKNKF